MRDSYPKGSRRGIPIRLPVVSNGTPLLARHYAVDVQKASDMAGFQLAIQLALERLLFRAPTPVSSGALQRTRGSWPVARAKCLSLIRRVVQNTGSRFV